MLQTVLHFQSSHCLCLHTRYHHNISMALALRLRASAHRLAHVGRPKRQMATVYAYKPDDAKDSATEGAPRVQPNKTKQQGKPVRSSGGYAVHSKGEPLKPFTNKLEADLSPNEIDILVTHNGVCHSDLHMRDDDWFLSKFPFIPGHEVVGEVLAVGSSVNTLRPGMRVGVGWMRDSCRRCPACIRGEENLCEPGYTGTIVLGNHGGFQAVMRVPADFAFTIPDNYDSALAAPLLCAGVTVFAPLKRYITRPGMTVAVLGIGGLGHLGIQFANAMGGVVSAIDIDPAKRDEAFSLGAKHMEVFDDGLPDRVQGRYDVILNCASGKIATGPLLKMMKNDGVLVQIGIPGDKAQMTVPLTDLVFGQKKVVGSIVGGRSDMMNMFHVAAAKGVKPMIEMMSSTKINEAFDRVKSGKARYRVVLDMNRDQDPVLTME